MKKSLVRPLVPLVALLALLGAASASSAFDVVIAVAPHVLLLQADQGDYVTVHVDIPFGDVSLGSVTLNGVAVTSEFADDCGDYVGKFVSADVKETVSKPSTVMVLAGESSWGEEFAGSLEVKVRDWAGDR